MSRTFNFSQASNHPNNIEDFELNAADHIDSIYIGPQGELLELLEGFNTRYDTNLGVTKQFTLKPGAYDEIKKAYANWVLRWDMKPRGIASIFKRIRDYGWRFNGIKQELLDLDTRLASLRDSGLRWQDNTDDFEMELAKLKSNVTKALEGCRILYPNVEIQAKILPVESMPVNSRGFGGRLTFPSIVESDQMSHVLAFSMHIKKPMMTVHVLKSDESIDQYELECNDILCCTGIHLLPLLSRLWGNTKLSNALISNNRIPWHCEAAYLTPMALNSHPYIQVSSDSYAIELEEDQPIHAHLCFGNMEKEIKSSLMNLQVEAHLTYLINWLTNYYIPQTQPLNRIKKMRGYGSPKVFVEWARNVEAFNAEVSPDTCGLMTTMDNRMFKFARRARNETYYGSTAFSVDVGSEEYQQRMGRYIDYIKEEDLPCNECEFNLDCDLETNIRLFLSRKELEPMEEAYLGMFIEIDDVTRQVHRNERVYYYVEEYMYHAFRSDIMTEYDTFILACQVADCAISGEEHKHFGCDRYRQIAQIAFNKPKIILERLIKMGDKLITWDYEDFREYRGTEGAPFTRVGEDTILASVPSPEEMAEMARNHLEDTDLTPEERTLRWASAAGGAANL